MATITEDYVSFETAKLLKEKGFNAEIDTYYSPEGEFKIWCPNERKSYLTNDGSETWWWKCIAPAQSMAMKWLREVHKLVICAEIVNENNKGNTDYSNPDRWYWFFDITNEKGVVIDAESDYVLNEYSSYEQACEAAIKYCLENLI